MNYTKGEWIPNALLASHHGNSADSSAIITTDKQVICLLGEVDEKQANAQLISTAPDMYEALKEWEYAFENTESTAKAFRMMQAAIAKAEGKI